MPENARWFSPPLYGLTAFGDLFTRRQLVALTTFSDLVTEVRDRIRQDDDMAASYGDALGVYLTFAVSKSADRNTSLCVWEHGMDRLRGTFSRQALPMTWDYAETNPLHAAGNIYGTARSVSEVLDRFVGNIDGTSDQADAAADTALTPPPPPGGFSLLIRRTTTTLATRTSPISSTSGCDGR